MIETTLESNSESRSSLIEVNIDYPHQAVEPATEKKEAVLGCFTIYWKGKRMRIVLKNQEDQLAFISINFKNKIEPILLDTLENQYDQLGNKQTKGFSAENVVSFQLHPDQHKFLYTTAIHSNVVMNQATKDLFYETFKDLEKAIEETQHSILIKSKTEIESDQKPILGNQRAQIAIQNLKHVTKDPEKSTWNPKTLIQRQFAKDPRCITLSTINTYLTALQKTQALNGNYLYYQILEDQSTDITKIHLRHPNQEEIPMQVVNAKAIPASGKLFLPIMSKNHFVSLVVDFNEQKIYFYNSGTEKLEHYTKISKLAQDLATQYNFQITPSVIERDYGKKHQDDEYNSGRYQLKFLSDMAENLSQNVFNDFTNNDISTTSIERTEVPKMISLIQTHVGAVLPRRPGQLV